MIIPVLWIHSWVITLLMEADKTPAKWVQDVTGIGAAVTPTLILTLCCLRYLKKKYPDSLPGRIPEPHERPSANRRNP